MGGKSCSSGGSSKTRNRYRMAETKVLQTGKRRRGGNGEAELLPVHENARKKADDTARSDGISPRSTGTWASAHSEQKTESAAEREEREQRRGCATLPRLVDCEKATWVAN